MKTFTEIDEEFSAIEKPNHFTNYLHCEECREHDDTLRRHTRESISLMELGNPGWDPICFIEGPKAFQYYLPALARLAAGRGDEYYLDQFLFHLNEGRITSMSASARIAVANFLRELIDVMPDEIDNSLDTDELLRRIDQLTGDGA